MYSVPSHKWDFIRELKLIHGVRQGSVLDLLQLCIDILPIGVIMRPHDIQYHIYADDTQL